MSRKLEGSKKKNNKLPSQTKQTEHTQLSKDKLFFEWAGKFTFMIMLVTIAALLFVGPFPRGLFFPLELLYAKAVIFGLLVIWGIFHLSRNEFKFLKTPLDLCLVILLSAYVISFFLAVHERDALEETLKIAAYLVVYLVAYDICLHNKLSLFQTKPQGTETKENQTIPPGLNLILHMLLIAGVVVTVASIGAAAGNWDFVGAYHSSRIASPMGYANAAAAYLMAAYFLTLALSPLASQKYQFVYVSLSAVILMTVVLTFSRGAWLLLPLLSILLVIISAKGERLRSLLYLVSTVLAAVPLSFLADRYFQSGLSVQAWLIVLSILIIAALLSFAVNKFLSQSRKVRVISLSVTALLMLLSLLVFVFITIFSPIHIERSVDDLAQTRTIKQVIENPFVGEEYKLSFEVFTEYVKGQQGFLDADSFWGLKVLGGIEDYQYEVLLDHIGGKTEGWEKKEFSFQTKEETTRLEIQLYNYLPGTTLTFKDVSLSTAEKEQKLYFTMHRILPERFYDRLFSYGRDRNIDRRFELFGDAIKVIKDHVFFGAGGGAWASLYHGYQDQLYSSRHVHNHFLQVWIEAGIFGFASFIGIWFSLTAMLIRNRKINPNSKRIHQFWAAVFLPVIALGAHSAIDWNFSLAAVGIFLFVLLAAGRSLDDNVWFATLKNNQKKQKNNMAPGIIGIVLGALLLIFTMILINGLHNTWKAEHLIMRGNFKQAERVLNKAIKQDPLRAQNFYNLSLVVGEQVRITRSQTSIQYMIDLARRAYELERYDPYYNHRYGLLLLYYVDVDEGLYYIDRIIELRPFAANSYTTAVQARIWLAESLRDIDMHTEAEWYLIDSLRIEIMMEDRLGKSLPDYELGRINYLLYNYPIAKKYFEAVELNDKNFESAQQYLRLIEGEDE